MKNFKIIVANSNHSIFAVEICTLIEESAKVRGTGIAKRNPLYIQEKMQEGKAVIALSEDQELAGFCYLETWSHGEYVAHSGLIVKPEFRQFGLAKQIKTKAFELSIQKFPKAKIFGLTTSLPVMKINSDLGYEPVTFSELTQDETFWKGCQSCVNYDILQRTQRKHCLCTGMLYNPNDKTSQTLTKEKRWHYPMKVYERWIRFKQFVLLKMKAKRQENLRRRQNNVTAKRRIVIF